MSWKRSGTLLSGPPTGSNSNKLDSRFRPNLGGLTSFQREQQLATRYGSSDAGPSNHRSEWDVLKENHRFIRDDEEPRDVSWEERLARAYESKLFKEFALIDLKHFKSKRLALRWRTAPEVVEGIGEDTCASLRCRYHKPFSPDSPDPRIAFDGDTPGQSMIERGFRDGGSRRDKPKKRKPKVMPELRSFELPFVYEEEGKRKEALVKVRLCPKCQAKLVWKPGKDDVSSSEEDGDDQRRRDRSHKDRARDRSRSPAKRYKEGSRGGRRRDH